MTELKKLRARLNRARSLLEESLSDMTVHQSKIYAAEVNELLSECRADDEALKSRYSYTVEEMP